MLFAQLSHVGNAEIYRFKLTKEQGRRRAYPSDPLSLYGCLKALRTSIKGPCPRLCLRAAPPP